jgi:hypothetical protein
VSGCSVHLHGFPDVPRCVKKGEEVNSHTTVIMLVCTTLHDSCVSHGRALTSGSVTASCPCFFTMR